ncbi:MULTISPECIES: HD-GYP domain-containing protein [unclassified Herbaspirillum]|uniref:HD-GYP domain-containing protein n=1 Tax=unclassified Herbaspirillum TaxID=2624150 RepID=UPI001152A59B|nr:MULTISPECIES: HD domain-containing phosphohydrolase [unclassified Herbaspirillum]MBB5389889.1 HD-GYP domain-containing protein (c-di-GMP phosphodiesterase class II) [Herbaspirillum sp. SJZ102]TQK09598.1 HD domain-containing protein [Herbaspirillum sp. SJZ130]TQK13715.1 HD domain-containing protein [Herbaspirillum sp. SJZ106]
MPDSDSNPHQNPIYQEIIDALVAMHRFTDGYTPSHEDCTATLCVKIATQLGLPRERIDVLRMAAQVHDIGKARIPLALLTQPGRITDEQYALLKTHVQAGYDILSKIGFPFNLAEIVWCHHEYLDGSGYPRGVTAESIPLESRILTVSDIVESISADRPYRKSLGMAAALDEIRRLSGTRLDPRVVDACLRVLAQDAAGNRSAAA